MIRIAIVNDMQLAIESLRRAIAIIPGASLAWIAKDGSEAVARCATDVPDVILMDMIMPVMDGVEATRRIMKASPCPILVVTATVEGNASKVFEALGAGALDAVATPGLAPDGSVVNAEPLVRKVQAIALLTGGSAAEKSRSAPPASLSFGRIPPLVAIGASTGGPQALAILLNALPPPAPWPIVIIQHIDPTFAAGLAEWLSNATGHLVSAAKCGEVPIPGRILLASSNDHLVMDNAGRLQYVQEPREVVYRPSVDVFFDSLATAGVTPGVAVILTGMGRDGALATGTLRSTGWFTIAQDQATSVVWGMPGATVVLGAATEVLPIESIGGAIIVGMNPRALRAGRAG